MLTLEPYHAEADDFGLLLPHGWDRVDPPADEVRLVAVEPLTDQLFRTNVVVTVDRLPEGLGLGAWQDGNDQLMPTMLEGWLLLDRFTEQRTGESAGTATVVRRLGHHINQGSVPVTMRQVALIQGRRGFTLTTSIWTPAYPQVLHMVEEIESSFPAGTSQAAESPR